MLALARIEAATADKTEDVLPQCTVLLDGLLGAMEQLQPIAEVMQVHVEAPEPSLLAANIAPELWQTLCTNVLLNAIQYSGTGSTVTVRLGMGDEQRAQCVISDQGEGIPADALAHVFHRFYRGDPSRSRASGGAGLGLAICKAIAEQVGGSIGIESSPGLGTTVTVLLPLAVELTSTQAIGV